MGLNLKKKKNTNLLKHLKFKSNFVAIISQVTAVLKDVFSYEWLPKEHLQWFENKVRHFDKHKKVNSVLNFYPVRYYFIHCRT